MLPKLTLWPMHPIYAANAAAKVKVKRAAVAEAPAKRKLGNLPEWNLADLYSGWMRREANGGD